MADQIPKLIDRLQSESQNTRAFFQAISPRRWHWNVYSEGANWTIHQILAHLVSAESGIRRLVRHILEGGGGVPEDFDLAGYNERKVKELEGKNPDELMVMFSDLRRQTIEMVASLQDTDLQREGRHPWLGLTSVGEILKLMYRHNKIHQRDIRRILNR